MSTSIPVCSTLSAADTNATNLAVCRECEPTALTQWTNMQPNDIGSFAPEITTVARNPISQDRNNRKGTVTALAASPSFTSDTFMDMLRYFGASFLYTTWKGAAPEGLLPTAVTATGYTVPSGGALAEGTLVYASCWTESANNGLKVVGSGSSATEVVVSGLVAEAGNPAAVLHVVGVRAAAGDLQIDSAGNLISTTLDFTTLGLTVGQQIHIGGEATVNRFATTADYGLAHVVSVTANLVVLGGTNAAFTVDAGAGKEIDLYFGSFARNVAVTDADFARVRHTIEATYNTSPVLYEYARDCYANTLAISFPNEDKSTMEMGFVGKDIEPPVSVRKDGAAWSDMVQSTAFNTASDFARIRIVDVDPLGLSIYLKDTTISIDNGASPETVLGNLGAAFVNLANFGVTLDTETVMVDGEVIAAIRNNTTVSLTMGLRNDDGGFVLHLPAMTLGDGAKNLAANEKVKITTAGNVFKDDMLGFSMGLSLFGYLPPDAM